MKDQPTNTSRYPKQASDKSMLFQLALSVGQSMSIRENCESFIKTLLDNTQLSYASIWLRENVHDGLENPPLHQFYATAKSSTKKASKAKIDYITSRLKKEEYFLLNNDDPNFSIVAQEEDVEGGSYILYRLGIVGFLKVYSPTEIDRTGSLPKYFSVGILPFGLLLNGLLAYENLGKEKETKEKIEEAFIHSEGKYRSIIESMAEGIIMTDKEGRVTFLNDQMAELSGYSKEEILGNVLYKLILSPENQKVLEAKLEDRLKMKSDAYTIECIRKDGSKWVSLIKASTYKNPAGEIIGTVGAIVDVTEMKRIEQKIADNEEKFRKIITHSSDAVVIFNQKGIVQEWSLQAVNLFGYSAEEVIGQDINHFISTFSKSKSFPIRIFGNAVYLDKIVETNSVNIYNNEFPIEISMNAVELKGEKLYSCFIRDISERKKAQLELINAKRAADQARLAEQQFLANMSHEIRTPMNAVIGMTYLLSKTTMDDTQKDYLESLNFSAKNLMGIINNILDISKIEAGEIEFERRSFNLKELLQSIHHTFQFKLKDKNIPLELEIDPRIENQIIGDSTRLNQILTNVLGNASKFTEEGKIGLRVKLLANIKSDYIIQFEVSDTGIGISKDKIKDIFENFKQAGNDTTRKYGGTGLGLPIVKQLVAFQGGSLEVDSEPNKGTRFKIILPFEDTGTPAVETRTQENDSPIKSSLLKKGHFLFVEDNHMNQKLITAILDNWDCSYEIANNGVEAVEMTSNKKYDMIFMDIHMPLMDGLEATLKIRRSKENPNKETPIIALTASALLEEKKRVVQVGMDDFLTKPLAPEKLYNLMLKYLKKGDASTIPTKEKNAFDLQTLRDMSSSNPKFFTEILDIYLRDVPLAIIEMDNLFREKQWTKIGEVAHKVKSNFMIFQLPWLVLFLNFKLRFNINHIVIFK